MTDSEASSLLVEPGFVVNDPFYAGRQWNMQRVNAACAWQMAFDSTAFTPTSEVIVAVVDSGLDVDHPDFKGRALPGKNYVEEDVDGDGFPELDPLNVTDRCGHGTHVAGIIAAALNDSVGVAGVAPNVKIGGWRALGATCGGTVSAVAQAIEDAALDGADIINLSLVLNFNSPTIEGAVHLAASQGVLMVAAAGNAGIGTVYWPARYPEVIAVAALNIHDQRTSYSNYGPEIEIAAPGGDAAQQVFSTWLRMPTSCRRAIPTTPTTTCASTAAPTASSPAGANTAPLRHQPGDARRGRRRRPALSVKPTLTVTNVRQILANTAAPLEEGAEYVGAGKLDVLAALRTQLPNALVVSPASTVRTVLNTADPFTVTVRVDNPSLKPIAWTATLEPSLLAAEGERLPPPPGSRSQAASATPSPPQLP